VREAVFSALGSSVLHAAALDLFAGSGAYGLEALSRGASFVQFVDSDRNAADALVRTLAALGLEERSHALCNDAARVLRKSAESNCRFDLVFLDPPYAGSELERVWKAPLFTPVLKEGCLVVVERRALRANPLEMSGLDRRFSRQYGEAIIEIFAYEEGLKP
jgi:16S rRNA (guanine966-N2)-methyltransferase